MANFPQYEPDIFSPEGILYPHEHYRRIRNLGPAVFLPKHNVWAVSRYMDVCNTLNDAKSFCSSRGVAVSEEMNAMLVGSIITSDGEAHARIRKLEAEPLMPRALESVKTLVRSEAQGLVERLKRLRQFDAVTDLAQYLPVQIVSSLVGLPPHGRERMLDWAAAIFQLIGPMNETSSRALDHCRAMFEYVASVRANEVEPGSWAARIFTLKEAGEIDGDEAARMLVDLIGPALDTTIFGITNMMMLFGRHPEQWQRIRAEPTLIPNAVNEVLRLESSIRGFTRYTTAEVDVDGTNLASGSRVLVLYASANRDERYWHEPASFDVGRKNAAKQLSFGLGRHSCLGMHLARLEMGALLQALSSEVDQFSISEPEMALITSLRGVKSMNVTLH